MKNTLKISLLMCLILLVCALTFTACNSTNNQQATSNNETTTLETPEATTPVETPEETTPVETPEDTTPVETPEETTPVETPEDTTPEDDPSVTPPAHEHTVVIDEAVAPKCEETGLTEGSHCSECNEVIVAQTEVPALGHTWIDATCQTPKTCSVCGTTEGTALGHTWTSATCQAPKTCSICGATEGTVTAHTYNNVGVCTACGNDDFVLTVEEAIALGLTFEKGKYSEDFYYVTLTLNTQVNANGFARATLEGKDMIISVAGGYLTGSAEGSIQVGDIVTFKAQIGCVNSKETSTTKEARLFNVAAFTIAGKHEHTWVDATCQAPKTCSTCGATEGTVTAHTYNNVGVCTACGNDDFVLTVEEAIALGLTFKKSNHAASGTANQILCTEDFYYVTITLNQQVNDNGFARGNLGGDLILSIAGPYNCDYVAKTIKLGDTVTFKAQIGCVNSATTSTGKEARLFNVVSYTIHNGEHVHSYGAVTVIVPPTCATEGTGTVTCSCGDTKEVSIPATSDSHVLNDSFACTVCGKSLVISVEEAIEIGMSYEKGQYSSEYYYVQLTLDDQVNANGFARAFISDGLYVSVSGGYKTNPAYVEGTIQLGYTVIYKAKLGAVNSAMTTGGKELRLYEVADYKIVSTQSVDVSVSLDGKNDILTHNSTYTDFTEVTQAPTGVTFDFGYLYVKKSGSAALAKSALVWNTSGKYSDIAFDLYVNKITDGNGNACSEIEFQLSKGSRFVSVVDSNGKAVSIVYTETPYVILQKGQSYHIVINVNDDFSPSFTFGLDKKTCELYFYNFSIEKSQYEYIIDNAEQTIVCKKDGETLGYFAWPTVTRLDGNRLIAVASGMRSAHTGMDGKLVCWYSEDEGKTWSEPQLLVDTLLDDRDAGVVYWNGKIIVSWFCASQAYYNGTSIDEAYDTKYMGGNYIISEDGGKTWSDIYCMPEGMFTPHGLIINPDGGLTSVGYLKYDKANRRWGTGIAVRTTTGEMDENGFIWSDAIVIADSNTQYSWDFQEPYGIYNDDGVLIVVMRSDKGLYQCELQPGATEFSAWHLIAFVQETPAHMFQHSSGVMIMTYGYRGIYVDPITGKTVSYTERNKDTTLGIRARFSYDGGLTWTQEVILSSGLMPASNSSDWGYTSSVELSDGKILTLFYQRVGSETKASIYQIVWEMPAAPTGDVTLTFVGGNDGGDKKIATVTGKVGETIVLPATPTAPGLKFEGWYLDYACKIPFDSTTYSKDLIIYAKWAIDEKQALPVMSFNVKVTQTSEILSNPRVDLVANTILENNPYVFGVQEADDLWMSRLNGKLGHIYTAVGKGRDGNSGEHSAIFYRTDMFTCLASGTKWLSNTPDTAGSKYSGTEGTANYPRIMTYVVLQRKSDGAKFIYVNAHLDNNGSNNGTVAENIRNAQVKILLAEIQKLYKAHGNLPTIVTGDFNTQPNTASYTTMIESGFIDSSKVAKQTENERTYNGNSDSGSVIFDYIFVSSDLKNIVSTYNVCPEKRDGKWISDHNAIIANITIPQTK